MELFGANAANAAAVDAGEATDLDAEQLPLDEAESTSASGGRATGLRGNRQFKKDLTSEEKISTNALLYIYGIYIYIYI